MSRRRYISTTMATDKRLNRLAVEHGDFAAMLYTWMIPHAADDTTLNGDVEELMAEIIPMRRDKSVQDVETALDAMAELGLIIRDYEAGFIRFPAAAFYAHQSFIKQANRREDWATPPNGDERRKTPQNASSFPSPLSLPIPVSDPDPSPPSEAPASLPAKRAARGKKAEELIPLTPEEIEEFAEKFADLPAVRDKIALALEHPSHLKYPTGQRRYLNNWLSNERARLPAPRSNSNGYRNGRPAPAAAGDETNEQLTARLEQRTLLRLGIIPVSDVLDQGAG